MPILTLPQAYSVLVDRQTAGVSLITWSFYLLSSTLFAVFGVIHKEKLLMVTYIPFVIVELAIVVGLLLFPASATLSDNEIREKFSCNRITQEVRNTDTFCTNPELYRQAVKAK